MTTTAITQTKPVPPATNEAPRPKAIRRKIIGGILGAAALGAVAFAAIDGGASGTPDTPPAVSQELQWTEVPGGCLADLECHGDTSQPTVSLPETPATLPSANPGYSEHA